MEPSILCTQDVQNHLNTLSEETDKTRIAGFLIGNVIYVSNELSIGCRHSDLHL